MISDRSSSPMRTPGTEGIRTCGTSSGVLSKWAFPATTSKISDRHEEVRSPGREGPRLAGRADQAAQRGAIPNSTSWGYPASSWRERTPRPRISSTGRGDERDQPFLLGTTAVGLPSYKLGYLALLKYVHEAGVDDVRGHLLYALEDDDYAKAHTWFERAGLLTWFQEKAEEQKASSGKSADRFVDEVTNKFVDVWVEEAGLTTYAEAVAEALELRASEGETCEMSAEAWQAFTKEIPLSRARDKAQELGVDIDWDCELAMTPEGYYQVRGGLPYAIARSLAVAPFSDLLWMETKTANLDDAREFAEAIHARFPDKMLAYNLSPSFNWDTTGMSEDEIREFPDRAGQAGVCLQLHHLRGTPDRWRGERGVRNSHQAGRHARAGATAAEDPSGRITLSDAADIGRGPRLDAALAASSGRTATTKAMGRPPPRVSTSSRRRSRRSYSRSGWRCGPSATNYQARRGSSCDLSGPDRELLELQIIGTSGDKLANVIFSPIRDRVGHRILIVRDQNTFDEALRQKRLMTLIHLYLVHRYKVKLVHYVSPTEDNRYQAQQNDGARDLQDRQPGGWPDHRDGDQREACLGAAGSRPDRADATDCQAGSAHPGLMGGGVVGNGRVISATSSHSTYG